MINGSQIQQRPQFDFDHFQRLTEIVQNRLGDALELCEGNERELFFPRDKHAIARDKILDAVRNLRMCSLTCDRLTLPTALESPDDDPDDQEITKRYRSICGTVRMVNRRLCGTNQKKNNLDLQDHWHSLDRSLWSIGQACGEQPDGPNWLNQFWWNGEAHHVPLKPYKLLMLLWFVEGNRCSDNDISYRIWGGDCERRKNVIKQVVKELNRFFRNVGCSYIASQNSGSVELLR